MGPDLRGRNAVEAWFYESCTIFRLGIVRLGVVQLVCCVLSAALGGALMWLNQGNAWAGLGCWVALPFFVSACWNLVNHKGRPRDKFSPCTIFNIFSLLCAAFLFLYAAFLLDSVLVGNQRSFPQYRFSLAEKPGPLIGVQCGLLIVSLFEFVAATWSASLSVGLVCLCCQVKENVFTIPYEEMEDGLPHGPDIVPGRPGLEDVVLGGGRDILPGFSLASPLANVSREPLPPALELEWDNFIGEEISDLNMNTELGQSAPKEFYSLESSGEL